MVVLAVLLILAFAAPALAVTGSDGAGQAYGQYVSTHAKGGHWGPSRPIGFHMWWMSH